ncbi:MAG TPA: tRNA (adenosine(37)-N6)-threonylcarbamoyltransferase complex dimerization subunit type 1 TsaB [Stackebrandtia sp.]|jgi:tRNA threonylcarbamoyl adenosine modification protein YeaZ|uniref:tRNA (adenosine(37)-N6)-threonylcarbamoyltransferase complex dimerization subunit type 1 TsaB n=1 Tax=Stackebrandtia sp. TaxID=2023065 RepID=UPI002D5F5CB5|nr:tRNA (adenosine(37)-N6)-threonylcarbamoyltransferase complex dimerization subunit type 1 TsaB [Stackebrandtia sp.]HZE41044.1 tRNA (adenosine(37)-N6)-threonylcarbamoyltransferase complex dimerization subunit type 1 TsaB [Stackebrandtia sp.]
MLILAVDTSTPAVTAAVVEFAERFSGGGAERVVLNPRAHGELLTPLISQALEQLRATPSDLGAIVAGVGPGPFTGLRAGLVTAAAMGHALSIPTYGVCSLDGIGATTSGKTLVATDARRKEIYWATYVDGVRADGPHVSAPSEVAEIAAAADGCYGDGAHRYADVLDVTPAEDPRFPRAAALVGQAGERIASRAPGEGLTPLYLRRPNVNIGGQNQRV